VLLHPIPDKGEELIPPGGTDLRLTTEKEREAGRGGLQ